jgi:hypothetical protein
MKAARQHHYWRVVIVFSDDETLGNRIFKDRDKAELWSTRQKKSPVVKKVSIEAFVTQPYRWRERC